MKVESLINIIGSDFYTGVPDSQLKPLCNYLMNRCGVDNKNHIIAANEGNSTALAAGYYLSTGKIPVVYLQNSGEGNIMNPAASLLNDRVYGIPVVFIVGWRGEPGIHDEPQHIYQGEITLKLLADMDIEYFVIGEGTSDDEVISAMNGFRNILSKGKSAAFVIRKNALSYKETVKYENGNAISREEAIEHVIKIAEQDPIISTTGKASRELFELREKYNMSHKYDFLTVGSMGHSSSIALGIAMNKPDKKIWCIDGDGALLMHMGAMAVIGSVSPKNMVHIVMNNGAHESVGGQPTAASQIDIVSIAKACGYKNALSADNFGDLDSCLKIVKNSDELSMIEVKCSIGARDDLGRPTAGTYENRDRFMEFLME